VPPAVPDTAAPVADALLPDGSTVRVRPVEPDDGPALERLLDGLSFRSRWFRFFSGTADVGAAARLAATPPGVVAVAGDPARIVGHALFAPDGTGRAEVAFEVADDWQGKGIGTLLLGAAAERAAERGIETLTAVVLPANHAMLDVFRDCGLPVAVHAAPGELELEIGTAVGAEATRRFGERERAGAVAALQHFLAPASVAVIGVNSRRQGVGTALLENLRATFDGPLHAIGRGQSVLDIPGPVELAVVAVPAASVERIARECAEKGVAGLLVVSAGFEDTAGRAARERLAAYCRSTGMRMIGPNCLGVASPRLDGTFARARPEPGRVALISQSGGVGIAALEQGKSRGLGLSAFVSIGDRADISSNDVLQWCEEDPGTDVIALYLESFGNPRRFARIARRVTRRKPIVAVKAGRSPSGRRAAGSHTGALVAASDATVDALFAQAGVIRTDTYGELLDVTRLLAAGAVPAGPRLGVITNGGGPAILLADAAEASGLQLPDDPVDLLGDATAERLRAAVAELAANEHVDALAIVYVPTLVLAPGDAARAITAGLACARRRVPAVAVFLSGEPPPAVLAEAAVPVYDFPEDAARALAAAARYGAVRAEPPRLPATVEPAPRRDEAAAVLAAALASGADWLEPEVAAELARCYGLPLVESRMARTPREAAAAAGELAAPVALKAVALGLVHKTDAGAVRLGLSGRTAVLRAARELQRQLADAGHAVTGFVVQRMAPAGAELLVGISGDPLFGPVVACAAGGTAAEVLADSAIRLAPLTEADVREMPRALRMFPLLEGHRGAPPADVDALEDVLRRVSRLADEQPAIAELDCNPVVVSPEGAAIVDLRVRIRPPAARAPIGSLQGP
jgi:acyl-CoA synthetase (NDP forming)/GNAT superfamily N-acetyltransferase